MYAWMEVIKILKRNLPAKLDMAAKPAGKYILHPEDRKGAFKWSDVDPESIFAAVWSVTAIGDSILFGKTKEGDCGFLMVLSGGLGDKMYPATAMEAQEALDMITTVAGRSEPP
jgi:hypothetical protein